ncbi:MAG: class I SAM-dependent methyltransferase [Actinomycetota bacterium]|nr:class I SAM-dependent methyltransferase [Actinomycetota bacterium]
MGGDERRGLANEEERRRWNDPRWVSTWPRRERMTAEVTSYLLDHLAPSPGERVLEIGSGGGTATFAIAERLPSGSVTGADISAPLCALARSRADDGKVANASFVVADAQCDTIPGGPFDAAASQFGVMFFEDPVAAFANVRSHVVPGGRFTFVCWCDPSRNPWLVLSALAPFLPRVPATPGPTQPTGPFSLADAASTTTLLEQAGWVGVASTPYEVVATVERDAIVDEDSLASVGIPEGRLDEAREAVRARLAGIARADGLYDARLAFQVFDATSPS